MDVFQSTRPVRDATLRQVILPPVHNGFNPRVPCGTRRHSPATGPTGRLFQSTRPVRDATKALQNHQCGFRCFNPRVPCGTRQERRKIQRLGECVSIHASRAGRDERQSVSTNIHHRVSIHASRAGRDRDRDRCDLNA